MCDTFNGMSPQLTQPFIFIKQQLILMVSLALFAVTANAQTFEVDCAQPADPPLVKTKFGVYQTPLTTLPRLLNAMPLLREINVADLRYEMGWGKPDALAAAQISGTASQPTYDFSTLDTFVEGLNAAGVKPLLAMGYCPAPLKSRDVWAAWKDMPADLNVWQKINRDYAYHFSVSKQVPSPFYEIWNEPDMPEPNGKMFFSGTPQDYGQLFAHAAAGIRQGDPNALIGGPAVAWNLAYLAPILTQPVDFASLHAYDNYPAQLDMMRGALTGRPDLPIFLTEYASFTEFPPNGPQSRYPAAMRFLRDVKGLLSYTDVAKVYWAQWLDAGDGPGMGLVTWDGHRKAIFNAFKIYGALPVDRVAVQPDGADGINLMAATDKHQAAVALWNESSTERRAQVNFRHLPFARGVMQLYRIDGGNASYVDNPASENLRVLQTTAWQKTSTASWQGIIPAAGVVFLRLSSNAQNIQPVPRPLGTYVRSLYWFPVRKSNAYADFDARTWTARLGLGDSASGLAQIGNVIDHPAPRWRLQVATSGPIHWQDQNALLGIRFDFPSTKGNYSRSVLFYDGLYDPHRSSKLPWGKGAATPDQTIFQPAMNTGRAFDITLARIAPADWNHQRVIVTFLLQNAGRQARAKFTLSRP